MFILFMSQIGLLCISRKVNDMITGEKKLHSLQCISEVAYRLKWLIYKAALIFCKQAFIKRFLAGGLNMEQNK